MLFQEIISQTEGEVRTIQQTLESRNLSTAFANQWRIIEKRVDFVPIFNVARQLLLRMPASPEVQGALRELANTALQLLNDRAALRHDLMGRIYHRLLADAKFFGAFYTKIPAATILLKLAVDSFDSTIDWKDADAIGEELKVGDLACGTGTLLKAALSAIEDRYVLSSAANGKLPQSDELHKKMIEQGLWGFDVLPSATHLAAAAVAMHDPRVSVDDMHFYTVPLGGRSISAELGSIEFAKGRKIHIQKRLLGASIGVLRSASKKKNTETLSLPMLNICTMNPPFTRSVFRNLLFGGVTQEERAGLQSKLQEIVRRTGLHANITAGLGSVFFAIGLRVTHNNGILAFVLPRTVLNGSAWQETQRLMRGLRIKYVIVSHEFGNWNFSESTKLSEVLLVMQRVDEKTTPERTIFVNLWRQPRTAYEATTIVRAIKRGAPPKLEDTSGTCELRTNSHKYGEIISVNLDESRQTSFAIPAAFAQTDLCRTAYYLWKHKIFLPSRGEICDIPLTNLNQLVELGPDGRDIYDGFFLSASETIYPALWGYDADSVVKLTQTANRYLGPLSEPLPGRHLRRAQVLWARAGTLMLPKELRLNTSRLCAIVLPQRALSNVWWPTRWRTGDENERNSKERELALWYNSSLGLFTLLMQRQETEGPWCKFPKAWFEELPTLDLRHLPQTAHSKLDELWQSVSEKEFSNISQIATDRVRIEIDEAFEQILGTSSLAELRQLLAREPLIRGSSLP